MQALLQEFLLAGWRSITYRKGKSKEKIEHMMDQIVWAFEQQLDMLFEKDSMDITSEIKVME